MASEGKESEPLQRTGSQRSAREVMEDIRTTQRYGGPEGYLPPTDALKSMGGETVREASVRLKDRQNRLPVVGLLAPAAFMLLENAWSHPRCCPHGSVGG